MLAETAGDPAMTHGQRLPGDLRSVLERARVRLEDVDLLAVAAGPGSFTGLRVGIASMQGLAFARGLRIVAVSTLDALAREARTAAADRSLIAPWVDAHRGEVFATLLGPQLEVLREASSASPTETLTAWAGALTSSPALFAGDGAVRYRDAIVGRLGDLARILEPVRPLAGTIGRLAAADPARGVLPHAVVPIYIRRPDAELARERRQTAR